MESINPPKTPDPLTPIARARSWQYSLWHLLALMAVVCVLGATYQWIGLGAILLAGLVLVVGLIALGIAYQKTGVVITVLLFAGVAILLVLPNIRFGAPQAARRSSCANNLKQIGIALHNYHDVYGSFPPAYVADANGKPMHSWRVLILPFLEQKGLYDKYRFDEPWDGPNNSKLAQQVERLRILQCPSGGSTATVGPQTSYVVVVGNSTAWPGTKAVKLADMQDGSANTILVVEVHNSGIHWMEPRDLHINQMAATINPKLGQGISSAHPGVAQVVKADGSVQALPETLPAETVRALLTIAGGETVTWP